MYEYSEKQDIWLFENDAQEYTASDEGRKVAEMLEYNDFDQLARKESVRPIELKSAFEEYWNARNGTGLHYSDQDRLERAKQNDLAEAKAYGEQN